MPSVFISSQQVDRSFAATLISHLRREGWEVFHSPRNPMDGEDPRWDHWYDCGLPRELGLAEIFVIVVDAGWDSASWMAQEAHLAMDEGMVPVAFYWNPDNVDVTARGMQSYLKTRLPDDQDALTTVLRQAVVARSPGVST